MALKLIELLKDYVKRFNQAILEVENLSDKVVIMAIMKGLQLGPLFIYPPKKANKYITAEELVEAKRRRQGKDDHKRKEPETRRSDYKDEARSKRSDRDSK